MKIEIEIKWLRLLMGCTTKLLKRNVDLAGPCVFFIVVVLLCQPSTTAYKKKSRLPQQPGFYMIFSRPFCKLRLTTDHFLLLHRELVNRGRFQGFSRFQQSIRKIRVVRRVRIMLCFQTNAIAVIVGISTFPDDASG